ncbi:MAG: NAD(P)H-dependent oxidoreductase subunit E [Proteobacteria bacterium]|nr:NAD(P)H-dependent oxidoreductase subunit E [Pseudomonadota bacterium]
MLVTANERLKEHLAPIAARHGGGRSALMPMLQEIQRRHSRITPYAMQVVADMLNIHPVEVMGVVSFYSFLGTEPKGRFIIRLCRTISCDMRGKDRVARQLETDLGIKFGETTPDGFFTLEYANCLGLCDEGPAMLVNDKAYTRVTPEMVQHVVEECRGQFGLHAQQRKEEQLI